MISADGETKIYIGLPGYVAIARQEAQWLNALQCKKETPARAE
jgi:hypothetical protein